METLTCVRNFMMLVNQRSGKNSDKKKTVNKIYISFILVEEVWKNKMNTKQIKTESDVSARA